MRYIKEHGYSNALFEMYESLNMYLEASAERERVKDFLENSVGKGYFDKYLKLRDRFTDKRLKDFNLIIKMSPEDVKVAIDRYAPSSDKASEDGGKKVVGENGKWTVYHVTSFPAAQELGEGTEWCITGRYGDMDKDDDHYFKDYIRDNKLDGGYYFYIPKDGSNDKYCLLLTRNGKVHSLWGTPNGEVDYEEEWDFPEVRGIDLTSIGKSDDWYLQQFDDAYDNDDADTWYDIVCELDDREIPYYTPALSSCIRDNKFNIFKEVLSMDGDEIDDDYLDTLLVEIYNLINSNDRNRWLSIFDENGFLDDITENHDMNSLYRMITNKEGKEEFKQRFMDDEEEEED